MTELKLVHRNNIQGRACIAPFINKWNVWDIPKKHWVNDVEFAILRAYELGRRSMYEEITQNHEPFDLPINARFK
jgi:hypothetical protein